MKLKFITDPKKETENLPKLVKLAGKDILHSDIRKKFDNLSKKELYFEIK